MVGAAEGSERVVAAGQAERVGAGLQLKLEAPIQSERSQDGTDIHKRLFPDKNLPSSRLPRGLGTATGRDP